MNGPPIRDAATVVLLRDTEEGPAVLMGLRGEKAAFMPSKYVFPGGAVDPGDGDGEAPLPEPLRGTLTRQSEALPEALAAAALRELREETGQVLPDAGGLRFIFRAITPPGRPRRFDARFFLARAEDLTTDPDDFSRAEDELSHLHWVPLAAARALDTPFITEVVLAETSAVAAGTQAPGTPFFDNSGDSSVFRRL